MNILLYEGGDELEFAVLVLCPSFYSDPIGFHKWPNNGHEIASHSTHYNLLAHTHH